MENNDFDEILVHCALGISRSPAVMAYIALILDDKKMFNDILSEKHFIPNKLILRKSMEYDYIIKNDNLTYSASISGCVSSASSETGMSFYNEYIGLTDSNFADTYIEL